MISVTQEREHVRELDTSYQRRLASAALDAYERLRGAAQASRKQLEPIALAARCSSTEVHLLGEELLKELAKQHATARDLLPEITIDQWHNWIRVNVGDAAQRRVAQRALNAFRRLRKAKNVSAKDVAPIVRAASSRFDSVWEVGTGCLNALAKKHGAAQHAMRAMLASPDGKVRFQLICSLEPGLPKRLSKELVRTALRDKSARVRQFAVQTADRLRLKALLPELEQLAKTERNAKVRSTLEWTIAMVRDGYLLRHGRKGNPELIVRTRDGWTSPPITKTDIARGKLASIIADTRAGRT